MAIGNMFIDAREAAEIIGVTKARVIQFVAAGRLAPRGKVGAAFVFDPKDVQRFAKKSRKTGRPKNPA